MERRCSYNFSNDARRLKQKEKKKQERKEKGKFLFHCFKYVRQMLDKWFVRLQQIFREYVYAKLRNAIYIYSQSTIYHPLGFIPLKSTWNGQSVCSVDLSSKRRLQAFEYRARAITRLDSIENGNINSLSSTHKAHEGCHSSRVNSKGWVVLVLVVPVFDRNSKYPTGALRSCLLVARRNHVIDLWPIPIH